MTTRAPSRTETLFNSLKEYCGRELSFVESTKPKPQSKALTTMRGWLASSKERRLSGYMNDEAFLKAYCSYYLPIQLPEIYWILQQNIERGWKLAHVERMIDIGCGPGTATLSYLIFCEQRGLKAPGEIHLLDTSKAALALARSLIEKLSPETRVITHRVDLRDAREMNQLGRKLGRTMDLVIISHMLNEFGSGSRSRGPKATLIDRMLMSFMQVNGHLLVVEPPLRAPTIELMELRDDLTEKGAKILAPCPAGTTHCPMLRNNAGWCHAQPPRTEARELGMAPWDKAIGRYAGIELSQPGFSYLLIGIQPEETSADHSAIAVGDGVSGLICTGKTLKHAESPYRGAYLGNVPAGSPAPKPPKKPVVR